MQSTEIGKAVNHLRKHGSKDIRQLARTLIEYGLVFSWISVSRLRIVVYFITMAAMLFNMQFTIIILN